VRTSIQNWFQNFRDSPQKNLRGGQSIVGFGEAIKNPALGIRQTSISNLLSRQTDSSAHAQRPMQQGKLWPTFSSLLMVAVVLTRRHVVSSFIADYYVSATVNKRILRRHLRHLVVVARA